MGEAIAYGILPDDMNPAAFADMCNFLRVDGEFDGLHEVPPRRRLFDLTLQRN